MPKTPKIRTLTSSSVEVLNAIRNNATNNYKDYVPVANDSADSIREIGAVIMDFPTLQNEFLSALVNRIGKVIITSKMYSNPWAMFKKGYMDFGETVEEIFVNIAKPFQYDPEVAEDKVFKRVIPDVKAAFHVMNYQEFYKTTIQQNDLRMAFLSWDGVTNLINKIIEAMYTAANYDEFLVMKYMLAKSILNGRLYAQATDSTPATNPKDVIVDVKDISNKLTFMSDKYNIAGVRTHTQKSDQYVIVNSRFDAVMSVEVLAAAFNMDKTEFSGHRVLIDGFGDLDIARLNELFANDPTYTEIDSDDLEDLNAIPIVVVDKDFFMIFDNLNEFTEQYNGEGLYWNYWYHQWKTFSISPYANAIVFVPETPAITSVTAVPDAVSVPWNFNGTLPFAATVVTTGYAPQTVIWSITTDLKSYTKLHFSLSQGGTVTMAVDSDALATDVPDTIGMKVTSTYDSTVYDEITVTLVKPESVAKAKK